MFGAVFFKEYRKIRWPWLTLLFLNGLLLAYIFTETRRLFALDHAEVVWYRAMQLGRLHYEQLKYAPILTGLVLSCIQYLPEMKDQRLRLSLHLPISPHRLILSHTLTGLIAVCLIFTLDLSALAYITARFFPSETIASTLATATPWFLAGLAAYLGVMLGLLEPVYRFKLLNLVVAAGVAGLFLFPTGAETSARETAVMGITLPMLVGAVLLPAYRFRYRRVS